MSEYSHLKFGCEFEFYLNASLEDEIKDALKEILPPNVRLQFNLETNDDHNMNYKNEPSLDGLG